MTSSNRLLVLQRFIKPIILLCVLLLHIAALVLVKFHSQVQEQQKEESYEILKLVDVEEFVPPPPPPKEEIKEVIPEETVQTAVSETVLVTEEEIIESVEDEPRTAVPQEIEYVPQHKISTIPEIPTKQILENIVYPAMALRQGLEGVVYLELFIDHEGTIRKIEVLKDPGFGFAEAAIDALKDVVCVPATANGKTVAVRFRYPVRFTLK
ncbi:MAG TPA: energy transducer TonB [Treponemataceae bacterium]|nr:energy transducer TonB [Treponemataceae bacterium]HQL03788.1 energy transducer TonB [Treponemataceae bacterium]